MGLATSANLRHPPLGRRLRLGFVGGGRGGLVGEWHASGARLSNHWDIVAGALSSDPANAAASARDWCIADDRSYGTYGAMAAAEAAREDGIEAVTICTPNWTHFDMASSFLKAGIDVILDKPMVNTLEDAKALVKLQRETGLVLAMTYPYTYHAMVRQAKLMVNTLEDAKALVKLQRETGLVLAMTYPYTYHAMVRQAKLMVAAGMIGKVRQVHVEYAQDWATGPADPEFKGAAWRRDTAKVGRASATGDIGTHAYHLLKYVTGEDVAQLRADFHVCGAAKAMEDTAFVNLRLANGAPGLLWVTQAAPGNFCGLRLRVFGEAGALEWDQEFPEQLRFAPLDAPVQILTRGTGSGMLPEAEALVVLPRGHGEALSDAWASLYAEIGLAVAARRSGQRANDLGLHLTGAAEGAKGVAFVHACADSHEAGGGWVELAAEV